MYCRVDDARMTVSEFVMQVTGSSKATLKV